MGISRSENAIVYQSVVAEEGGLLSRRKKAIISETTRRMIERYSRHTLYFMILNKPPTAVPVHVTSSHPPHVPYDSPMAAK